MSTLLIGLDITDSHITSALIRVQSSKKISIERDTYFTRLFEIHSQTDPRDIIDIWIECINDLLLDYVHYYEDNDRIVGISIGIPGPMDYSSGVCLIQSMTFAKFFGLNLRLAFRYGLKELLARWKKTYFNSSIITSRKSLHSTDRYSEKKSPHRSMKLNIPTRTIDELGTDKTFPNRTLTEFCGLQDDDEHDIPSYISRSRRETYFHDIEISTRKQSSTTARFTSQLWTILSEFSSTSISFSNDAICFALGECLNGNNQGCQRILALTLGMNFGSAFLDRGQLIIDRIDVPPGGTLWNCPYDQHSIADDWFSTRGLINIYKKFLRHDSPDDSSGTSSMTVSTEDIQQTIDENVCLTNQYLVRQASNGNMNAIKTFQTYARLLGQFLIPYINTFRTELIVIAGDLAQVWYLLEDELNATIQKFSQVQLYFSLSQGKSITLGAVQQHLNQDRAKPFRLTDQPLLPVVKTTETHSYDIYPIHRLPSGTIGIGHRRLNEKLLHFIERDHILLIDGFVGTFFDQYAHQLNEDYYDKFKDKIHRTTSLLFYDSRAYLQTDSNHQREICLQDLKSSFGRLAPNLDFYNDFLDVKKFECLKNNLSYPCVVIGPGSSYVHRTSPLIYIDLAKNELAHRLASKISCSYLKPTQKCQSTIMYERKCLYYLDYPVFNKLKQEILPRMNYFVDGQRPNCPTWIDGKTFRQALVYLSSQPIRFRPCFESDSSGGQWLKTICPHLSRTSTNYSQLIENGLILADAENHLLELSTDIFYSSQAKSILGNDLHYRLFHGANEFPIRMNFLDTIGNGYLPRIQCHPSLAYIRTNFGEKWTQDQTAYIIETKQDSLIYLGFRENLHPDEFHRMLMSNNSNMIMEKSLQCVRTHRHEFFLIPNETIYAMGSNQVILEISASPSIYSFQFSDSSHIEHAMKNLKFDRRAEQLHCQAITQSMNDDHYKEEHLPTHALHYYDVHRLIIDANENIQIVQSTENRFHLCMLVEGDAIEVEFSPTNDRQYNYLESFFIPASIQQYRLRPIIRNQNCEKKSSHFVVLIAFLKWDCDKILE